MSTKNRPVSTYTVYFQIYNKKMKSTVEASNEEEAAEKVREKIEIHRVVRKLPGEEEVKDILDFFGIIWKP